MSEKKRNMISAIALVICGAVAVLAVWGAQISGNKTPNTLEADPVEDSNYDWLQLSTGAPDAVSGTAEGEEEKPTLNTTTVIEEDDGSITIDRTWGEKQSDDADSANMGSGGGNVPLAEDGVYYGDQPVATATPEPAPASAAPAEAPAPVATPAPVSGSAPKSGDTRVDENGTTLVYSNTFGWVKQTGSEQLESTGSGTPGTGEIIGSMG